MARDFDGVDDRLLSTASFTLPTTSSISVWQNADDRGENTKGKTFGMMAGGSYFQIQGDPGTDTNWRLVVQFRWSGAFARWITDDDATTYTTGSWQHICITYDGGSTDNDPIVYIDGVSVTATETTAPSGTFLTAITRTEVGNSAASDRTFNGRIAELAVWSRILTAGEAKGLSVRFSPLFYSRGLISYYPLSGNASPEVDQISKRDLDVTGAVKGAHDMGIIYPAASPVIMVPAAVVTGNPWHVYAQN